MLDTFRSVYPHHLKGSGRPPLGAVEFSILYGIVHVVLYFLQNKLLGLHSNPASPYAPIFQYAPIFEQPLPLQQ